MNVRSVITVYISLTSIHAYAAEFECLIEPRQTVELRASVDGPITHIHADRGDYVEKGQVLVELDAGVDKAKLELARYKSEMVSAIHAAAHRAEFSLKKLDRENDLFQKKFVSAHERDEAETGKNLADAEVLEARDNKRLAQLEMHNYDEMLRLKTIRSPFKGVVMERNHHPGEVTVGGNDNKPILKLAEIDPLYVEVIAPAIALGHVSVGQEIFVIPDEPIGGRLSAKVKVVDQVIDAASGTLGIRLELPNPSRKILAGIRCKADFPNIPEDKPRIK